MAIQILAIYVQNMFEINYSQLIQYEILEKLVTYIDANLVNFTFSKVPVTRDKVVKV